MKLLFENWREYISEVEEVERTHEEKLKELFLSSDGGNQAVELAKLVEIDKELQDNMQRALELAHALMQMYLKSIEEFEPPHRFERHGKFAKRIALYKPIHKEFRDVLFAVEEYGGASGQDSTEIHKILRIFGYNDLRRGILFPERIKGEPEEQEIYDRAKAWAGPPQQ